MSEYADAGQQLPVGQGFGAAISREHHHDDQSFVLKAPRD